MNFTTRTCLQLLALVLSFGDMACDSRVMVLDCETRTPCPADADDSACVDLSTCDAGHPPVAEGHVTIRLVNTLPVQATFYASGGGTQATTEYYEMRWLPSGTETTLPSAMTGPLGSELTMTTLLKADGFPPYTLDDSILLNAKEVECVISAARNADGFAVLSTACSVIVGQNATGASHPQALGVSFAAIDTTLKILALILL